MKQIQLLAQKGYYEKVEPILQKNLKLLENLKEHIVMIRKCRCMNQ